MSETTKTPRPHAEMAAQFMADSSLKCWAWAVDARRWVENERPRWYENLVYHVAHEKPTAPPKRRVTLAGITFNAPEVEPPEVGAKCWAVNVESVYHFEWGGSPAEQQWLAAGQVQLDEENAHLHALALRELNRQLCGMEDAQ